MESASETGCGKIGESAKKSHKNDSGLQGFELRGTVDKVWANNAGEKEEQRRLNRSLYIRLGLSPERNLYSGRGSLSYHQARELGDTDTNYLRKGKEQ